MKWTHADGVGAVVISPTRELASQIFYELNKGIHVPTADLQCSLGGGCQGAEWSPRSFTSSTR